MHDLWNVLAERSRTWNALVRQGIADDVWQDYVTFRFGRTGDPRALEYLYPYLNHADRRTRACAIGIAGRVFEGRGPNALDALTYFTKNPDLFIRDRAVCVVGPLAHGQSADVVLSVLEPYLAHPNRFIRKLAFVELGRASAGLADERILNRLLDTAKSGGVRDDEIEMAVARLFAGRPTERAYGLVAKAEGIRTVDNGNARAVVVLVKDAAREWYERACGEIFAPRLAAGPQLGWFWEFAQRDGIASLSEASPAEGMSALNKMLPLRNRRCTGHALLGAAPNCFAEAPLEENRVPLVELLRTGDVSAQCIAARCLGRLTMGKEDQQAIAALRGACSAGNGAVRSSALVGLGMAARSGCDESIGALCLQRAQQDETAAAALRCLGMVYMGSGSVAVLKSIVSEADRFRSRPVRGKKYCRPLAVCYYAAGLVYLGTGASEPVQFLLDVLAVPPASKRFHGYRWAAARALIMTEFAESKLGWSYVGSW